MTDRMNPPPAAMSRPADADPGAPDAAIKGVFHGLMLALPAWIAGGCITFILM